MHDFAKGRKGRKSRRPLQWVCCLGAALLLAGTLSLAAQGPGGGHGGGPGRGFPGIPGGGPMGGPGGRMPGGGDTPMGSVPGSHGPMQRGPAGRWWDDNHYAHSVGLTADQQRRMDGVFAENRAALISGLDTLHKAEARLNDVSSQDHPSESALNAEIQNVAQARADLQKANTHMLLQIRNEMTGEQLNRLDKLK